MYNKSVKFNIIEPSYFNYFSNYWHRLYPDSAWKFMASKYRQWTLGLYNIISFYSIRDRLTFIIYKSTLMKLTL